LVILAKVDAYIFERFRHSDIAIYSKGSGEASFFLIFFVEPDVMICREAIQEGKASVAYNLVNGGIYSW
jgi:hypothetical protein